MKGLKVVPHHAGATGTAVDQLAPTKKVADGLTPIDRIEVKTGIAWGSFRSPIYQLKRSVAPNSRGAVMLARR